MIRLEKENAAAVAETAEKSIAVPAYAKPQRAGQYVDLSRATIYNLMNAGVIKTHKVRGARLVDMSSLLAHIAGS